MTKYGSNNAWKYCTRVFDLLTVAAIIDNKILCIHGGLSPDINTLGEKKNLEKVRFKEFTNSYFQIKFVQSKEIKKYLIKERCAISFGQIQKMSVRHLLILLIHLLILLINNRGK